MEESHWQHGSGVKVRLGSHTKNFGDRCMQDSH